MVVQYWPEDALGRNRMDKLSLDNPLFATYVVAATLMILKVVAMAWLTVWRMTHEKAGFRRIRLRVERRLLEVLRRAQTSASSGYVASYRTTWRMCRSSWRLAFSMSSSNLRS